MTDAAFLDRSSWRPFDHPDKGLYQCHFETDYGAGNIVKRKFMVMLLATDEMTEEEGLAMVMDYLETVKPEDVKQFDEVFQDA